MPLWSIRASLKIVSLNLLHCYQFIDTVRCIVLPILSPSAHLLYLTQTPERSRLTEHDSLTTSLPSYDPSRRQSMGTSMSRSSLLMSGPRPERRFSTAMSETDGSGPVDFIHEAVVPQPPPEWQPFGYPLAHTICLVTAYSEGQDGLRTTLDSIATTEYPNSHKTILVVCDGMVKGHGENITTPEIALSMLGDYATLPDEV